MFVILLDKQSRVIYYNDTEFAQDHELEQGILVDEIPLNPYSETAGKTTFLRYQAGDLMWVQEDAPTYLTPEQQRIKELEDQLLLLADEAAGGIL